MHQQVERPSKIEQPKTEKEYRAYNAINSTTLAKFDIAPDVLLMKQVARSYFNFGHAFETALQDVMTGSEIFDTQFFEVDTDQKVPEQIYQLADENLEPDELDKLYVHNKDGSLSKTKASFHFWLDQLKLNPGLKPINATESCMINQFIHNIWECKVEIRGVEYHCGELLSLGDFQVPLVWEDDLTGLKKKALYDALVVLPDEEGTVVAIDFKALASYDKMNFDYRKRYWVQDRHYSEGLKYMYEDSAHACMIFLVASKELPYLVQTFPLDIQDLNDVEHDYHELIHRYWLWDQIEGRPSRGWRATETVKYYPKQQYREKG